MCPEQLWKDMDEVSFDWMTRLTKNRICKCFGAGCMGDNSDQDDYCCNDSVCRVIWQNRASVLGKLFLLKMITTMTVHSLKIQNHGNFGSNNLNIYTGGKKDWARKHVSQNATHVNNKKILWRACHFSIQWPINLSFQNAAVWIKPFHLKKKKGIRCIKFLGAH